MAERKCHSQEKTEKLSDGRHYVPNKRGGDVNKKSEEGKSPNSKDSNQQKSGQGSLLYQVKLVCNTSSASSVR